MSKYPHHVEHNPNFPEMESDILKYWEKFRIAELAMHKLAKKDFIFYDGPPFANGLPHYGHLLTGFAKDVIARFHTMLGERVLRKFGWDCHGLPAEMAAEKELGLSGGKSIETYGIDKFNEHCAGSVMKYADLWRKYVARQGRWVSFDPDYKTMDLSYMESILWSFKTLYQKGLIYEDYRVMPYSWACETPLSNFETRLDNSYREKTSKTVVASFVLTNPDTDIETRLLAWTTTPWTLPSNLALAVNSEMEYERYLVDKICFVAANMGSFLPDINRIYGAGGMLTPIKGEDLVGLSYAPLFPYFQDIPGAFQVLHGHFVSKEGGTGIVHVAPGFGEDDFNLCKHHGIPVICPINNAAVFTSEVLDLEGIFVLDANDIIIAKLKESGNWLKTDQYVHSYPHCWRTDTPLIYRAMPSWYLAASKISERMTELSREISWVPEYVKDQFSQWLAHVTDWSISRNRFFGTPLPIWKSDNPKYPRVDVYGSIAELERDFNVKINNLHRQYVDKLSRPNPDDPTGLSTMRRVPEVFDCWYESGAMPFASEHYPFNPDSHLGPPDPDPIKHPPKRLPADFVVEYTAQIRGWFYTLMVLSTALFNKAPFTNGICHGVVLDGDGKKLSKRLNNYLDSFVVMEEYGADSMRYLMMSSPVMSGGTLYIDVQCRSLTDVIRLHIKPIWNAYAFLVMYANADKEELDHYQPLDQSFDRYMYLKMSHAVAKIRLALESYKVEGAYIALSECFENLDNWYIRRNKRRFWKNCYDADKKKAYNTLYTILDRMSLSMAPLLPYLAESIYLGLNNGGICNDPQKSVHMQDFPKIYVTPMPFDGDLIADMDVTRRICNAALAIRSKNKVRVRQPLSRLTIVGMRKPLGEYLIEIIKDEINVKAVEFDGNIEAHCDIKPKVNFPMIGRRIPHRVKEITKNMGNWQRLMDGKVRFGDDILLPEEISIAMLPHKTDVSEVMVSDMLLVVLDLETTDALWGEGIARDVTRSVQMARQGTFDISDRIITYLYIENERMRMACEKWHQYIAEETLSVQLLFEHLPEGWPIMRFDINEEPILIGMRVVV